MNFLAHAYLSGNSKEILLGNLIGDFVKGRQMLSQFEPQVVRGVELHRAIDEYTDNHPVVHRSKNRLRAGYRHYAGVIIDVFYDHFLAAQWKKFHHQALAAFASDTYSTLRDFSPILPVKFRQMLPYMIRGNWLLSYADISGIHKALSGMASRTPYKSNMEKASGDLKKYYAAFSDEFEMFFPDLKRFAAEWLASSA